MQVQISTTYHSWIDWIGKVTGMSDSVLHVHAGLIILLIARIATRKSLGSIVPLSFVFAAEAFNEIMDRLYFGSWRPADTLSDILHTIFWPVVLFVALKLQPPTKSRALSA